jgi:glycosyltransferase involved in cell wall biosynthesis
MNIGFMCEEYPPCNNGGIGTYTKLIAEGLAKRGHKIIVFGHYSERILPLKKKTVACINDVVVIRWPFVKYTRYTHINHLFNRVVLHFRIKKLVAKYQLELIEASDSGGMVPFGIKTPLITRLHGTVTFFGEELRRSYSRYISFFEKMQLKRSNLLIGVSQYVLDKTLVHFGIEKNGVVSYNAVYPKQAVKTSIDPNNKKTILYYGSVMPKKGVIELVKAFNELLKTRKDVRLKLIGKTLAKVNGIPIKEYLYSLVEDSSKSEITFVNHLNSDELEKEIQKAYCCVFPSYIECFSIAPMEAMAYGKPVIYSELHSGPELINHGEDGLLINPSNIKQLVANMQLLLDDKPFADKLGENAYQTITNRFDMTKWLDENELIMNNLIQSNI